MKTIIAGSRGIEDLALVEDAVRQSGFEITEVVSGGARGIDVTGEAWAKRAGVPIKQFIPKWRNADGSPNRSAGMRRNEQMAYYAQALIAVWDGQSPGTRHMINFARKCGLRVFVYGNP